MGQTMKSDFDSVDDYMSAQPEAVQAILERVRGAIRKALRDAEAVISYKIPAYKVEGSAAIYFPAWKEHYALYPGSDDLITVFKDDLTAYEVRGRTIRFAFAKAVPVKLIERLAKFRAKEVIERRKGGKASIAKRRKPLAKSGNRVK